MGSRGRNQRWQRPGNFGVAAEEKGISDAVIRQARHSGQLNLSNKGLTEISQKVWRINIDVPEGGKDVGLDAGAGERWWEQTDLRKLILASNQLKSISSDIKNLPALTVLDVHDNQLESLPEELGDLAELSKMHLSHNKLHCLPENLANMQSMKVLLLSNNLFETLFEDFGKMANLEELDLSNNQISILPKSFGNLLKLRKLDLSHNKLSELSTGVVHMRGLQDLNLQSNKLTSLPQGFENLKLLSILDCRSNLIKELPTFAEPSNLKEIYLGNNRVEGLNPDTLKLLPSLVILDVKDNTVQSIPEEVSFLVKLERLDLTNNCISGLPTVMGTMESLKSVSLEGNPLRGIRRDIISKGTQSLLKYLKSRIVPADTHVPTNEKAVNGPGKQIKEINDNIIPDMVDRTVHQICATKKIEYSNKKATSIPDVYFVDNNDIRSVDFSKNLLDQVPMKLTLYSQHLTELCLNSNKIKEIPKELSQLTKLQFLDVGNNLLSSIPVECQSWQSLVQIIFSGNRFQAVPEFLYNISTLENILATSNQITSIDVNGLMKLPRIANLDLSNNNISNVPPELGNVVSLKSLHIEGNSFRNPRHNVLSKGTTFILEYLRDRIPR